MTITLIVVTYLFISLSTALAKEPLHLIIYRFSLLYPLTILWAVHYFGVGPGLIGQYGGYYNQYLISAIWGVIVVWIATDMISVPLRRSILKKIVYLKPIFFPYRGFIFCLLIFFSALAFPHAFGLSDSNNRFNLISGSSTVFILLLAFLFSLFNLGRYRIYICILLLFLAVRGERADVLLPMIFFFFRKECSLRGVIIVSHKTLPLILIGSFAMVLGALSFILRSNAGLDGFLLSLIYQNTLVDVSHVYLSSFLYVDNHGHTLLPFFNILESFVPMLGGVKDPSNFTELLQNTLRNPGGGLAYTAFYISFGFVGFFIYGVVYWFLLNSNLRFSHFNTLIYIITCLLILRVNWYGVTYIIRLLELSVVSVLLYYFYRQFVIPIFCTRLRERRL